MPLISNPVQTDVEKLGLTASRRKNLPKLNIPQSLFSTIPWFSIRISDAVPNLLRRAFSWGALKAIEIDKILWIILYTLLYIMSRKIFESKHLLLLDEIRQSLAPFWGVSPSSSDQKITTILGATSQMSTKFSTHSENLKARNLLQEFY
jgi:hypothetical protein